MKFSDSFLDEIRARLPVSQVVSRRVPLKRAGREWKGLSPFNKEKTPSFTVNDQKGFYHCFSSSKHGDIFTFLMETEGLSFPEAVERLAGEAGVPMPAPDPQYERTVKERLGLLDALEAAAKLFEEALARARRPRGAWPTPKAAASPATPSRNSASAMRRVRAMTLKTALIKQGFTEAQLLDTGLIIKPDDGRPTYDRFRNRLTIPILDAKSRVIAFGARALDADAQPKYLNSPETRLFDKGSMVFNFARARVIRLRQGRADRGRGLYGRDRAPSGGLQERGRDARHRLHRAPDGGAVAAGAGAGHLLRRRQGGRGRRRPRRRPHAARICAKVIPSASPSCPMARTPTTLCAARGPPPSPAASRGARPLIDMLWTRETSAASLDTPERRAAFEARLETLLGQIGNARVKDHYAREVKNRLFALWRRAAGARPRARAAPRHGERQGTRQGTRPGMRRVEQREMTPLVLGLRLRHHRHPGAGQSPLAARSVRRGGGERRGAG